MEHLPEQLISAYLDSTLDEAQSAELSQWVLATKDNARYLASLATLEQGLVKHARMRSNSDILTELQQAEESAEVIAVPIIHFEEKPALTKRELKFALSYVFEHATANKRALYTGGSAIAAVLMLALTLIFVFSGGQDEPVVDPLANIPLWDTPTPKHHSIVATLTAEHDALWEKDFNFGTPELGDTFRADRSVTLLAGFAELTTAKDAVVLLEGPCTVAFDADINALRLEQGKLVADVPLQAVGFTVRTPKAQVIDYGTTFGVEVRSNGATKAVVFDGEVELGEVSDVPGQPTRSVRLTEGWSSSVSHKGALGRMSRSVNAEDLGRFAKSIDEVTDPGFAYRRAVLASKPILYWAFEEGAETTRNLAGSSELDGQAIGQTTQGEGLFGKSLTLTGEIKSMGGFASVSALSLAGIDSYTLEAWCWIDRSHYGRVLALAELDPRRDQRPKHLSMIEVMGGTDIPVPLNQDNATLRYLHRNPISFESAQGKNVYVQQPLSTGQWVHVATVHDGKQASIYLNGELVQQSADTQAVAIDRPLTLFVGVSPIMLVPQFSEHHTDYRPFAGRIDEVAVYGSALNQQTIRSHVALGQNALTR